MFNINSGYKGSSRSVRSEQAIEDFEVPMSMITKAEINDFIDENNEFENLRNTKAGLWKYVARDLGATSWHHTGKYFNETDHYSLELIAEELQADLSNLNKEYKESIHNAKKEREQEKNNFKYATIEFDIWGGTRKHPRIIDTGFKCGIMINDWVYDLNGSKHNIMARKTESFKMYNSYKDLVKANPNFKGNVKKFNKLIKEHTK